MTEKISDLISDLIHTAAVSFLSATIKIFMANFIYPFLHGLSVMQILILLLLVMSITKNL